MKRIQQLSLLILTLAGTALFAEEQHIIDHFDITIDGVTRENALLREMDLKEGQVFASREEALQAVEEQKQELINTRVFNIVEMDLEELSREGDISRYKANVFLDDTWTIIPFPYPKYDSNTGFRIGMKFFYDNALGSLNNFYLGMNLDLEFEEGKLNPGNWTFNPQLNEVKIGDKEYNFGIMQQFSETTKKDSDGTVLEEYSYYNSEFSVDTRFNLGNDYFYKISPSFGFNYGYDGDGYEEEAFYMTFGHSGGYSKVDWIKNFREGYSLSAGNDISFKYLPAHENKVTSSIDLDSRYYKILHKRLNYTNRAYGVFSFNDELTGLGDNIRGVENDTMYGIAGAFMSHDLTIGVIQWEGVGEAQFQPFFDMGVVKRENADFDRDEDFRYGAGADFILYLDAVNSLHARGTIAVDLSSSKSFSNLDKYEIIITSSLSY